MAAPVVTLEPTSGAVGTQVTIIGVNFESYRGDRVFIFFDGEEINSSLLTIPQEGSFIIDVTIPADAASNEGVWTGAEEFCITAPFAIPSWA
ncbi:hypothetical protein ACFLWZ_05440 [Chloroflexota bacterium]